MSHAVQRIGIAIAASFVLCGAAAAQTPDLVSYKRAVAERIAAATKLKVSKANVRDISVVGYTIDSSGQVKDTWIVRAAEDKKMNERALDMFNKSLPLPTPPASLFSSDAQVSLSEAFVFTADGQFRLQSLIK